MSRRDYRALVRSAQALTRTCVAKDRKSTIVFAVNVAHVRALTKTFQLAGVDARYIYAATPTQERNTLIDGFKAGDFPVLINCGNCTCFSVFKGHVSFFSCICTALLTEGTDIPNVDCVIVARPTRSRNVFLQMVNPQYSNSSCFLRKSTDWSRNEVVPRHWKARLSRY